ncbi:MAG: preprotein translocase subunit SecG [Gammaproteobacteria bacterium]|nr:preprotein translocase subunit SecG [Gammaproteobacteria bacterium]
MTLQAFFLMIQVFLAITLISLILLQHGKGAQAGAAFGSGASGTVFGARGSAPFLTKATTFLAIVFFANSLMLAYLSARQPQERSLVDQLQIEAPAVAVDEPSLLPADVVKEEPIAELDPVAKVPENAPADVPPVE